MGNEVSGEEGDSSDDEVFEKKSDSSSARRDSDVSTKKVHSRKERRRRRKSSGTSARDSSASDTGPDLSHRVKEKDSVASSSTTEPAAIHVTATTSFERIDSTDASVLTSAIGGAAMSLGDYQRIAFAQAHAASERAQQLTFAQFAMDPYYASMTGGQAQMEVKARAQTAGEIAFRHQLSLYFEQPVVDGPMIPSRRFAAMQQSQNRGTGVGVAVATAGVSPMAHGRGAVVASPRAHARGGASPRAQMAALSPAFGPAVAAGKREPRLSVPIKKSAVVSSSMTETPGSSGIPPQLALDMSEVSAARRKTSSGGSGSEHSRSGRKHRRTGTGTRGRRTSTSPGSPPTPATSAAKTSAVFTWPHGGRDVYLCHSGDGWKHKYRMHRAHDDFTLVLELRPGVFHYKFIVDATWRCAPDQRLVRDATGAYSNVMEVRSTSFVTIEERKRKSGEKEYTCELPKRASFTQKPPTRPPHLSKIVLNSKPRAGDHPLTLDKPERATLHHVHVAESSTEGVVTVGMTERFKDKFITTVFYKSVQTDTGIAKHSSAREGFWTH